MPLVAQSGLRNFNDLRKKIRQKLTEVDARFEVLEAIQFDI